ncbi:MAG: hypothetical protein ABI398_10305 [Devosia sp.]
MNDVLALVKDDLIILPLGILPAVKLIPSHFMAEFPADATRQEGKPRSIVGLIVTVCV